MADANNSLKAELEKKFDASTGQFIDPLFAVVITVAVERTIVEWVKNKPASNLVEVFIVAVGFTNLLLSWFGYHKSIIRSPIKGILRFIITVVLLPLYMLSVIMYDKPFQIIYFVYVLIFFLWSVWEYFKALEYGKQQKFWGLQFRLFNLLVYIWMIPYFLKNFFPTTLASSLPIFKILFDNLDVLALTSIAVAIAWLRILKSSIDGEDGDSDKLRVAILALRALCLGEQPS